MLLLLVVAVAPVVEENDSLVNDRFESCLVITPALLCRVEEEVAFAAEASPPLIRFVVVVVIVEAGCIAFI